MKKRLYFILLFGLILSLFFASAAVSNSTDSKAYACLEDKVNNKCSTLTIEEKIFSLLAISKCKSELLEEQSLAGCFPKDDCNIKTTAQSILALKLAGESTFESEEWLLSKSIPSSNVEWFLQIDPIKKSSCILSYSDKEYSITIDEEKEINKNAGNCLSIYNDYWFKITPSCYNQEFEISCNESFLTSLLYKKKNSDFDNDFYVSDKINSASAEGKTNENVKSSCFSTKTSCDYEGTLWATLILNYLGKDTSEYMPYLISMMEENSNRLPESFLYTLTGEFETELLSKQKENKFWLESGDRFYDTALALLPFQNENTLTEKTNSKEWLSNIQGNNGCWQDNIRNTAFILYSLWAKKSQVPNPVNIPLCEDSGNFCLSNYDCSNAGGEILSDYSGCFGTNVCCSKDKILESCSEKGGELCDAEKEICLDGTELTSSDSTSDLICCSGGRCTDKSEEEEEYQTTCESMNGECKAYCSNSEESIYYSCSDSYSNVCCVSKKGNSLWVVFILLFLIVLVVLGILFKEKIKIFFLKSKFKGKKPINSPNNPKFPPSSANVYPGAVPRKIIPYPQTRPKYNPRRKTEVDDVLKKLKDISK